MGHRKYNILIALIVIFCVAIFIYALDNGACDPIQNPGSIPKECNERVGFSLTRDLPFVIAFLVIGIPMLVLIGMLLVEVVEYPKEAEKK